MFNSESNLKIKVPELEKEVTRLNKVVKDKQRELDKLSSESIELNHIVFNLRDWVNRNKFILFINANNDVSLACCNPDTLTRSVVAVTRKGKIFEFTEDYNKLSSSDKLTLSNIIACIYGSDRKPFDHSKFGDIGELLSVNLYEDYYYELLTKGSMNLVFIHKVYALGDDINISSSVYTNYESIPKLVRSMNTEAMKSIENHLSKNAYAG